MHCPSPPPEVEQLKEQVLQLSNKINDLTEDYPIVAIVLAQTMAQTINPYVCRSFSCHAIYCSTP